MTDKCLADLRCRKRPHQGEQVVPSPGGTLCHRYFLSTMASIWKHAVSVESLTQIHRGTAPEYLGIEFLEVGDDFISARIPVDERTRQPYGILHGGGVRRPGRDSRLLRSGMRLSSWLSSGGVGSKCQSPAQHYFRLGHRHRPTAAPRTNYACLADRVIERIRSANLHLPHHYGHLAASRGTNLTANPIA